RDTGSFVNSLAGGRLFPGEHQRAAFQVSEDEGRIAIHMRSDDGEIELDVVGRAATQLPATSGFATVSEASAFFEGGGVGYSVTSSGNRLDGVVLKTDSWHIKPFFVERAYSSYFDDLEKFPIGSVRFDCGLVMRNTPHQWEAV